MAMVQRGNGGRRAVQGAAIAIIGRWLQNHLENMSEGMVERLAERVYEDITMAGSEAANAIAATVREYSTTLTTAGRRELTRAIGTFEEFGRELVNSVGERVTEMTNGETRQITANGEGSVPNIGDLIPGNTENNAQVGERRNRDGTRRINSEEMDGGGTNGESETGAPEAAARSGAMGVGAGQVSKETPISQYPSLSYGLPETHTTILPFRTYFSVAYPDTEVPIQAKFRMNAIWDMVVNGVQGGITLGQVAPSKGIHDNPLGPGGSTLVGAQFPPQGATTNSAAERPQWRDYWVQLYQYYTVLGCKWRVTVENTSNARGADIEVAVQYDSYSDTATSTGNVMPLTSYIETKAFKNITWHVIQNNMSESSNQPNMKIFDGTYKPGQIKRNIVNDGDVKTWTATGTTLPNLKEMLTLNFFKGGMSYAPSSTIAGNVCVELDYIVQFKDLKLQARYPNSITASQDITQVIAQGATDQVRIKYN